MLSSKASSLLSAVSSTARCLVRHASESTHYLQRTKMSAVAYRHIPGHDPSGPGVIFLPGFQSNMQGVKALALERYCLERGLAYTRFDYQGCGESTGDLRKILFSDWKQDVLSILDTVTAGQQVLVGSSMGAWLALLVTMERHHRIHSIIGLSTAPDISQRAFQEQTPELEEQLATQGECILQTEWGHYVLTKHFLDEIQDHFIMDRKKIPIRCPIRFIHGMRDTYVPYQNSIDLAEKIQSDNVLVLLRKKGDHRLSQPEDIQLLFEELDYAIKGSDEARKLAITSWASFSVYSHPEHMIADRRSMKEHKVVKAME